MWAAARTELIHDIFFVVVAPRMYLAISNSSRATALEGAERFNCKNGPVGGRICILDIIYYSSAVIKYNRKLLFMYFARDTQIIKNEINIVGNSSIFFVGDRWGMLRSENGPSTSPPLDWRDEWQREAGFWCRWQHAAESKDRRDLNRVRAELSWSQISYVAQLSYKPDLRRPSEMFRWESSCLPLPFCLTEVQI